MPICIDQTRPTLPTTAICAALALALTLSLAPLASAASPVERHQTWTDALQKVLDNETSLTAEQVTAVDAAIREMESGDFTDHLDEVDRQKFRRQADTLLSTLSCQTYSGLVDDLGELTPWLDVNQVAVEPKKCNCAGDEDCADGFYCKSINCTSELCTRNWGRCDEKDDAEPVAAEPVAEGVLRVQSP